MRILIDTHVFLWIVTNDLRLPQSIRAAFLQPSNTFYLSVVSLWEVATKYQLGKLPLPMSPELYVPEMRRRHVIANLDLDEGSVKRLSSLPMLHKDPFDRMLICQALEHNLTMATVDDKVRAYPIPTLP